MDRYYGDLWGASFGETLILREWHLGRGWVNFWQVPQPWLFGSFWLLRCSCDIQHFLSLSTCCQHIQKSWKLCVFLWGHQALRVTSRWRCGAGVGRPRRQHLRNCHFLVNSRSLGGQRWEKLSFTAADGIASFDVVKLQYRPAFILAFITWIIYLKSIYNMFENRGPTALQHLHESRETQETSRNLHRVAGCHMLPHVGGLGRTLMLWYDGLPMAKQERLHGFPQGWRRVILSSGLHLSLSCGGFPMELPQ